MNEYEKAKWSRFCGGLLGYINDYYNRFIRTDYEIILDMTIEEVKDFMKSDASEADKQKVLGYTESLSMICAAIREGRLNI